MKRAVIYSPSAQKDRSYIRAWFMQAGSGQPARTRLAKLEAAIATLAIYPLANRPGSLYGTRQLISQGHKVVYEVEPDQSGNTDAGDVIILRIFGPGQSDT